MASSVGLYLKNGALQAAHVAGSSRHPRLKSVVRAGWKSDQQGLTEWLAERRLPSRQVSVALPSRLVSVRKTTLPLTHLSQIRRTIKFHAERMIPGVSPDDILVDFFVTRKEADSTELLLFVVKKADLEAHIGGLRLNGIEVESITVDVIALFNLLSHSRAFAGASRAAVVDYSGEGMNILLVRDGVLLGVRSLPATSGADATESVARELKYAVTSAGLEGPLDRVLVAGKPPEGLELPRLEGRVECELRLFSPPKSFRTPKSKSKSKKRRATVRGAPVPAGTALDGIGGSSLSVNFRGSESAYRTPYEIARKPLLLVAVLLVAWIGLELVGAMLASSDATTYLSRLHGDAKSLFSRVVKGKKAKFSSTFHRKIESLAKQQNGTTSNEEDWDSFLDFLKVMTENLPSDTRNMIQSVNFRGEKAIVRGEAEDVDSFEEMARGLEKSGVFEVRTPFQIRSGRKNRPARLSFTIELSPRRK